MHVFGNNADGDDAHSRGRQSESCRAERQKFMDAVVSYLFYVARRNPNGGGRLS